MVVGRMGGWFVNRSPSPLVRPRYMGRVPPSPSPHPSGLQSKSVHGGESSEPGQPLMAGKICGQHQKERMSHSLLTFQETRININILDVCPVPLSLITVLAESELCFSSFQEVFLPWHSVLLRHLSYQPPSSPQSFLQPESFECYGFFSGISENRAVREKSVGTPTTDP